MTIISSYHLLLMCPRHTSELKKQKQQNKYIFRTPSITRPLATVEKAHVCAHTVEQFPQKTEHIVAE